ncbi:MAG TPA: hypothetical protein DEP04_08585 [Dehalococcoidia bacterium]|nr:hypothetical protein [Chloroflexota bacterium]HCE76669.1 hypothetical protein [Dehalococcoidia bacterium]
MKLTLTYIHVNFFMQYDSVILGLIDLPGIPKYNLQTYAKWVCRTRFVRQLSLMKESLCNLQKYMVEAK